jgi:integrase
LSFQAVPKGFEPAIIRKALGGETSNFANLLTVDYNATLHILSKEINPNIVQEQLGHASIDLTLNTYSHVIKSMRGIAANALEEVVGSD